MISGSALAAAGLLQLPRPLPLEEDMHRMEILQKRRHPQPYNALLLHRATHGARGSDYDAVFTHISIGSLCAALL